MKCSVCNALWKSGMLLYQAFIFRPLRNWMANISRSSSSSMGLQNNNTNKQQPSNSSVIHHFEKFNSLSLSLSLWLTYSHAFPHAGKIIRIASHSFASFPLWLVFFSSFLFFSFRFVWNLLKRFIAKILSQHIFLRLSTLWLQIIFLWNLRRWCFVNKCVHK